MVRTKTTEFIDSILIFIVSCFFCIAVVGYFSSDSLVTIICGLAAGISVMQLCKYFGSKKKSDIDKKVFENVMLQFYLQGSVWSLNYFFDALERFNPTRENGYIIIDKTAIYVHLKSDNFKFADFCELFSSRDTSVNDFVIFASGFDSDVISTCSLLANFNFKLINSENTFRFLRKLDALPKCEIELKKRNKPLHYLLSTALRPDKCKRYLFVSLILICTSLFMPSPFYYMVFASLCLVLTFLAKIDLSSKIIPKHK